MNFTYCKNQEQVIRFNSDAPVVLGPGWFAEEVYDYTGDVSKLPNFDDPGMPWDYANGGTK